MLLLLLLLAGTLSAQTWDVVIGNGRVIDPETGLDAVRWVGIRGGNIGAISASPLEGRTVIDARGLVVSPGFIDLHEHGQDFEAYTFQARDGVTSSFELEVGTADVAAWYAAREGSRRSTTASRSATPQVRMK
jgi:N-acyl-D-aspartate/D-glutamate deacylase